MFSARTAHDPRPNRLTSAARARLAAGLPLLDATASNPTETDLPPDVAALLRDVPAEALRRYEPEALGGLDARLAAAALLGSRVEHTLLTASTSEAYAYTFAALADPGDRVAVPRPSYPLLEWIARFSGVELVPYDLHYDGRWELDEESVRRALARGVRAVVAVSPNNPTGSYLRPHEARCLTQTGAPLVVDEVFAPFVLEGPRPVAEPASHGLVVRLSGLSKRVGMPQLKVGFVALEGDTQAVETMRERLTALADTFLSVATPSMRVTAAALAHAPAYEARVCARARANLARLDVALAASPASRLRVEGGLSVMVRLPAVLDDEAHALALVERHGVLVHPGHFYDQHGPPHVVLSLLLEPAAFAEAADAVARYARSLA